MAREAGICCSLTFKSHCAQVRAVLGSVTSNPCRHGPVIQSLTGSKPPKSTLFEGLLFCTTSTKVPPNRGFRVQPSGTAMVNPSLDCSCSLTAELFDTPASVPQAATTSARPTRAAPSHLDLISHLSISCLRQPDQAARAARRRYAGAIGLSAAYR